MLSIEVAAHRPFNGTLCYGFHYRTFAGEYANVAPQAAGDVHYHPANERIEGVASYKISVVNLPTQLQHFVRCRKECTLRDNRSIRIRAVA
jgi:hypothetical protein